MKFGMSHERPRRSTPSPYQVGMGAPLPGLRDHAGGHVGAKCLGGSPPRRDPLTIEQVPRSHTWDYSESRRQKLPEHGGIFLCSLSNSRREHRVLGLDEAGLAREAEDVATQVGAL